MNINIVSKNKVTTVQLKSLEPGDYFYFSDQNVFEDVTEGAFWRVLPDGKDTKDNKSCLSADGKTIVIRDGSHNVVKLQAELNIYRD